MEEKWWVRRRSQEPKGQSQESRIIHWEGKHLGPTQGIKVGPCVWLDFPSAVVPWLLYPSVPSILGWDCLWLDGHPISVSPLQIEKPFSLVHRSYDQWPILWWKYIHQKKLIVASFTVISKWKQCRHHSTMKEARHKRLHTIWFHL